MQTQSVPNFSKGNEDTDDEISIFVGQASEIVRLSIGRVATAVAFKVGELNLYLP